MKKHYIFKICLLAMMLQFFTSIAATHTLRVESLPDIACSFNTNNVELETNKSITLSAYTNYSFKFLRWEDESGATLSTDSYFQFTMPDQDVTLYAVCEYNPENPANPAINYWNKESGEVIIDDLTPGNLSGAIYTALAGSSRDDVNMITVSGIINNNDLGIINNYKNCYLLDLSRVSGVTEIPSYAFDYTNLETVYLPAAIEKIGQRTFYDCKKLTSLTVYAMVPPILESDVFTGVQDGLVVYAPAAAISRYQEAEVWKDFIILPIQEDIRSISVSLPEGTNASDYAQMWLELTNVKSGQRVHYVMTDRQTYTFANVIRNTTWIVCLRNERGDIFGQIENVEVKEEDVAVSFASLSKPQLVNLIVLSADGADVTVNTQVTWFDASDNYLAQSLSLCGLLPGSTISYKVALSQELAMQYVAPLTTDYVVGSGDNHIRLQLEPIKQITLSGRVKDAASKTAFSGANITASQTFDGKYSKTVSAKTDVRGNYSLTVSNVPTSLAISAPDYISQTMVCDSLMTGIDNISIPDISLKAISGAVISIGLTYTKCPTEDGSEDTFQEWYADYNNVSYNIYNKTKQKTICQFNVQYPQIVLLEEVEEGDVLEMTASSKNNAFLPVKANATIDAEQRADAMFNIVELGKIKASFVKNSNESVVGSLYDGNGKLVKSYNYSGASLTINNLTDGSYTLITMGRSKLFNNIYDLSRLPQTGLVLGFDYTQTSVQVNSGKVSAINIEEVPTLDESKLYYTGENTSFTVNKSSIVAGNYLTLTGHLDFKSTYAGNVSNVNLIVDLPESCEFVENSVMVGNNTSSYVIQNNRVTIPMDNYSDRVRFCIIPTRGGEYAPSSLVQFDIDGETITQPIGSTNYTVKDLSISVPSTVAKTTIPVSGTAIGVSTVEIYDNGVLIGQTTSLANGSWFLECVLNKPFNLTFHNVNAKIISPNGLELLTETKECYIDTTAIRPKTVKMNFYNEWMKKNVEVVFDIENQIVTPQSYSFYSSTDFTFIVDFVKNDTSVISDVYVNAKLSNGEIAKMKTLYDNRIKRWVANKNFSWESLPVNVYVDYKTIKQSFEPYGEDLVVNCGKEIEDLFSQFVLSLDSLPCTYHEISDSLFVYSFDEDSSVVFSVDLGKTADQIDYYNELDFRKIKNGGDEYYLADTLMNNCFQLLLSSSLYDNLIVITVSKNVSQDILNQNSPKKALKPFYSFLDDFFLCGAFGIADKYRARMDIYSQWLTIRYNLIKKHVMYDDKARMLIDAICSDAEYRLYVGERNYYDRTRKSYLEYCQNSRQHLDWRIESLERAIEQDLLDTQMFHVVQGLVGLLFQFANKGTIQAAGQLVSQETVNKFLSKYASSLLTIVPNWVGEISGFFADTKILNSIGGLFEFNSSDTELSKLCDYYRKEEEAIYKLYENLYCDIIDHYRKCEDFCPNCGNLLSYCICNNDYPIDDVTPINDPSGYVYEAISSNRLQGVTATAFYKENVEDMYGDLYENIVKWDAEAYAQENPLFTDENGMYAWDVPQGLWQVKFEKEGYETTYSEWLPVPPPQLDVNIAMKQNVQPNVKNVHAYEDAVVVEFDKYMMPELLNTDNIIVMAGNKQAEGTVELLNEKVKNEGESETFASKLRFNAAAPFEGTEVTLMVNNRVKSYAGIRMQDNFQQTFAVEKEIKQIVCDSLSVVAYGQEASLIVSVLPAAASCGKTITVQTSSSMILGIESDQIVIDQNGKAEIYLTGYLPGVAGLTFSIEGTDKTATTIVKVIQPSTGIAVPKASILSGSVVTKGTSVALSCATADATIYYTLDGSCPCDEDSRLLYTGPIIVDRDLTIKAMAIGPDGKESEIAEFSYFVDGSGIENIFEDNTIQIYPSPVKDYLTVNAHGQKLQTVTLTNMNGVKAVFDNLSAEQPSIDVHALPSGPYVIEVITDLKSTNQIVIKK